MLTDVFPTIKFVEKGKEKDQYVDFIKEKLWVFNTCFAVTLTFCVV